MFQFIIRDVLWLTLVVTMGLGWWRDHRTLQNARGWWSDHLEREHSSNPNDYKRLFEREGPPF